MATESSGVRTGCRYWVLGSGRYRAAGGRRQYRLLGGGRQVPGRGGRAAGKWCRRRQVAGVESSRVVYGEILVMRGAET
ncbi:hypothetical protein GCM10022235_83150 [Kribbella ginsengisoli]|uniref:Uncharacterized protein n=1 Tax=Kribbella ginsengisoli TaxID=363865 RepID=A0ABP6Z5J6_9ACTN